MWVKRRASQKFVNLNTRRLSRCDALRIKDWFSLKLFIFIPDIVILLIRCNCDYIFIAWLTFTSRSIYWISCFSTLWIFIYWISCFSIFFSSCFSILLKRNNYSLLLLEVVTAVHYEPHDHLLFGQTSLGWHKQKLGKRWLTLRPTFSPSRNYPAACQPVRNTPHEASC